MSPLKIGTCFRTNMLVVPETDGRWQHLLARWKGVEGLFILPGSSVILHFTPYVWLAALYQLHPVKIIL